MLSTKYSTQKLVESTSDMIWPGNPQQYTLWRARQLQIVASFVNGKTTWWNLLLQAQKERPRRTMLSPFFPPRPRHRQKAQGFGILIFSQVKNWYPSSEVWEDIFKKCWLSEPSCLSSFGPPENYMKISMFGAFLFCSAWSQTILHRKDLPDELVFGLDKSEPPSFWHGHQSKPPTPTETQSLATPSGSTLEIGKKERGPTKSGSILTTFFFGTKNRPWHKLFTPDSTTGLSKSISKTHNKESSCDEARPSLWDVFNPGSEEG